MPIDFFWDLHQQHAIGEVESSVSRNRQKTGQVSREVFYLQNKVERLQLITEALWQLVRDKTGLTDEELKEKVKEVDLSDGVLDGKVRKTPQDCPSCKRTVSKRFPNCIYCGTQIESDPFG